MAPKLQMSGTQSPFEQLIETFSQVLQIEVKNLRVKVTGGLDNISALQDSIYLPGWGPHGQKWDCHKTLSTNTYYYFVNGVYQLV